MPFSPEYVLSRVEESAALSLKFFKSNAEQVIKIAEVIVRSIESGGKLLLFGNGGSAADCQHFASELVNRYEKTRKAIPAMALTIDTATITSIANDSDYAKIFARQIEALGGAGDIAMGISTSGASPNISEAFRTAGAMRLTRVGLLGREGGEAVSLTDYSLVVPGKVTARIQETQKIAIHILCELIEERLGK